MPDPTITIDKSVPMPTHASLSAGQCKYPFSTMKVGDSFAVTTSREAVRQSAFHWRLIHDKSRKFSVLKTPDGYRCWRVA